LKEYKRELDGGLKLFLEDNAAGFEYGYAETSGRKPIMKKVNLVLQEAVCSFGIAGSQVYAEIIGEENGMERMFDCLVISLIAIRKKGIAERRTLRNAIHLNVNTEMMIVSSNSEGAFQ